MEEKSGFPADMDSGMEPSATDKRTINRLKLKGLLVYGFLGIVFGVTLVKGEMVSWLRMQEMFRFESFQMYGFFMIILLISTLGVYWVKKTNRKTFSGETIVIPQKKFHKGLIIGGLLFGLGWGITGACPGPMVALIGNGYLVSIVMLASAILGTWVYGLLREKLPH